jgi:hypothetical protein
LFDPPEQKWLLTRMLIVNLTVVIYHFKNVLPSHYTLKRGWYHNAF